ncbi:MAG: YqgE/AlgH family protein [Alphaproteobacteria bacterium]
MASGQDNHYLKGKLLLAMPSMGDPRFERAVVFICAHDKNGAMGLVINQTMPNVAFSDLVKQLKLESDIKVDFEKLNLPVMCGGPVESARGFLLHSSEFTRHDTMNVDSSFGVTGTVDALKDVACGNGPEDLLFILGYAGWTAGQLDTEIQQNAWLVIDAIPELIFAGTADEKWARAVETLGIDPSMLSTSAGRA